MVRTGFVKSRKGECLQICFERPDACNGCRGCSKGMLPKHELLTVFGEAEVGDIVDVEVPEAQVLKASALAYAVPLCTLLIGLIGGYALGCPDILCVVLALVGLALGYAIGRASELRLRKLSRWRPTVVAVRKMETPGNERKDG